MTITLSVGVFIPPLRLVPFPNLHPVGCHSCVIVLIRCFSGSLELQDGHTPNDFGLDVYGGKVNILVVSSLTPQPALHRVS